MSNLYLANECLPFDTMPFCSGLRKHVPSLTDLLIALDAAGREHEFMAGVIKNNTEQKGMLYTQLEQMGEKYRLDKFEDVETLKNVYNKKLPNTKKQQARRLIIDRGYIFIEAYTNPAVNNLKRKVAATSDCEFLAISKFNNKYNDDIKREYDIIFMDECSTISNKEMKEFLELAKSKLLVLVGDTYQIEAIEFGNWFDAIRGFLPATAICELVKPYRSNSKQLQALWDNVRKMEDDIEIILCLNYGGL